MESFFSSNKAIGIISGGQLGKMIALVAKQWDVKTFVLDKDKNCPAGSVCDELIIGDPTDEETILKFSKLVDKICLEVENVNVSGLLKAQQEGVQVFPNPEALSIIQDKGLQKAFYSQHQIPTSEFQLFESELDIIKGFENGLIQLPFVQKLRTGGYDGQGVKVIRVKQDLVKLLKGKCIIEKAIDIEKEIAVIVARNKKGEIKTFPIVEMAFNLEANLVEELICPAEVPDQISQLAKKIAIQTINALQLEGILAVEFFVTKQGEVLVNEIAPRPHNSGHHTIEAVATSQYEQLLRIVLGLPMGSTELLHPSILLNLLGEKDEQGPVRYEGIDKVLEIDSVHVHVYGKKNTFPYRKMGHITITGENMPQVRKKCNLIKNTIKITAWKNTTTLK